ncbi:hypothetical protein D3C71_758680 [compost metagenome]
MDDLMESISNIIIDYADGEFGKLDKEHVERWINQFDEEDRVVVLEETNSILQKTYITKESFNGFIGNLIQNPNFSTTNPIGFWKNISLLNIQRKGNSQSELISLLCNKIEEHYSINLTPRINSKSIHYIYLDDFLFSGGRLISDLSLWIDENAPNKCTISIVLMGWYKGGHWYVKNKLTEIARDCKKEIDFNFWSFEHYRLENRMRYKDTSDVLWPIAQAMEIPGVKTYIDAQSKPPVFREYTDIKGNVLTHERRTQYEMAMLKSGLKILGYCQSPNDVVKPLGYNRFDGFGFGSTIFSFRNCPNNNPLAYWWGNPNAHDAHPFSKWYPLLQRKTYGSHS